MSVYVLISTTNILNGLVMFSNGRLQNRNLLGGVLADIHTTGTAIYQWVNTPLRISSGSQCNRDKCKRNQ